MEIVVVTERLLGLLDGKRVFHSSAAERRWRVGERLSMSPRTVLEPYVQILAGNALPHVMGAFSYTHSALRPYVAIGRYSSIGLDVRWLSGRHPVDWATTSPVAYDPKPMRGMHAYFEDVGQTWSPGVAPQDVGLTRVGHDVWIGDGAMIGFGVKIGDGAVVGARSLVLKDVPPYSIAVGSPATVKRPRFDAPLVERFQRLAWWRFRPELIQALDASRPASFLDRLEEKLATDPPPEMRPVTLTAADILAAASGQPQGQ